MAKRTKHLTSQGMEEDEIRINKFLSDAGVCSRREADRYIEEGKVLIDGVKAEMGSKVSRESVVTFMGKPVKKEEKLVLIALNKPEGIVCTTDTREPDNIIDFINYGMRIYPIGRLDKDSEGLILLTNDGNIVNKILRAENHHEKEYIVTVNKELTQDFIKGMSQGVPILDTVTMPCEVSAMDRFTFRIILTQGLNRQIRRMCEYFGYRVIKLTRIRIMNIHLGRLKTGIWRNVTEKEIEELNRLLQTDSGKNGAGHMKGSKRQSESSVEQMKSSKRQMESSARQKESADGMSQTKPKHDRRDNKQIKSKAGKDKVQVRHKTGGAGSLQAQSMDRGTDRIHTKPKTGVSDRGQSKPDASGADRSRSKPKAGGADGLQAQYMNSGTGRTQAKPKAGGADSSQAKPKAGGADRSQAKPKAGGADRFQTKSKGMRPSGFQSKGKR